MSNRNTYSLLCAVCHKRSESKNNNMLFLKGDLSFYDGKQKQDTTSKDILRCTGISSMLAFSWLWETLGAMRRDRAKSEEHVSRVSE